jgi:hypothetical protein
MLTNGVCDHDQTSAFIYFHEERGDFSAYLRFSLIKRRIVLDVVGSLACCHIHFIVLIIIIIFFSFSILNSEWISELEAYFFKYYQTETKQ